MDFSFDAPEQIMESRYRYEVVSHFCSIFGWGPAGMIEITSRQRMSPYGIPEASGILVGSR